MRRLVLALALALVAVPAAHAMAATPTAKGFSAGITANSQPERIAPGPDGNLWFTERVGNNIGRITPSGAVTELPIPTAGSTPKGITAGPDGNLWFAEGAFGTTKVGQITPSGTVTEFTGLPSNSALTGIAAGPDGNLWLSESNANRLAKITPGGTVSEITLPAGTFPQDIATGPDGNLWFTEFPNNKIGMITTDGTTVQEFPLPTGTSGSNDIAAGPDGNLWFTEQDANLIGRVTPSGVITEFSDGITASSGLTDIAAGPDGNIWFTEGAAGRVGRITPAGVVTEFDVPGGPVGITAGPDANLWFTLFANGIGRITTGLDAMRFTDPARIEVPKSGTTIGPADVYPLTIDASGLQGTVTKVSVRLNGVHHSFAGDIEALLVGPQGQKTTLIRDASPGAAKDVLTGQVITLDDAGLTSPARLVSGIFKPILGPSASAEDFGAPAPAGPYANAMSVFNGTNPNGQWKLFVQDDLAGNSGVITGGWSLDIQTTGQPPAQVVGPPVEVQVPGPPTTVTGPGETVTVPGPTVTVPGTAPADTTRPSLKLTGPTTRTTQTAFRAGPKLTVTPSEPVTLDVTLSVKPKTVTIAALDAIDLYKRTLGATGATAITAKPSARLLGRPKTTFTAQLRIVATDKAGNRATVTKTITVHPDKKKPKRKRR